MPTSHIVGIVVFDEKLFVGRGMVNRWMVKLTAGMHGAMVAAAPKRTGHMASTIDSEVRHIGTKRITGVVGPTVPYAGYVLRGTGFPVKGNAGLIYTTRGFADRTSHGYIELWKPVPVKDREWPGQTRKKVAIRQKGHWLHIPADMGHEGFFAHSVRGQEPNNFILKAYRVTRRRHRSLPIAPEGVRNP